MNSSARATGRFQLLSGGLAPALVSATDVAVAADIPAPHRLTLPLVAGRFVELSGQGAPLLTLALSLVRDAQRAGENTAWVSTSSATFYAPDAAALGIDLAALPIIIAPPADPVLAAGRAASHLLRSGAFGLVVLDLAGPVSHQLKSGVELPMPLQSRLVGLAQKHGTAILSLTRKGPDEPSLGSLVSLHLHATRDSVASARGSIPVKLVATKDKRHGPGWSETRHFRAPDGLGLT